MPSARPSLRSFPLRAIAPILVILATLATLTGGCSDKSKAASRGPGPAPVLVGKVERKPVPLTLDAIGAVEPSRTVSVRSQVTGTLLKIDFQEGQDVKEGDLLFEIDPRPFQNALRSAEADLQKARVQFQNAHAQSDRYRSLSADEAISKEQFQSIEDAERSASAQVLSGEAAVANARLQLEYCSIHAPISGRTGSYGAHEGDLITSSSATPLVVVNQLSPTYVTFGVPQHYLAEIARYRAAGPIPVAATPAGGTDPAPEKGELNFIDNAVDTSTGTIRLKAAFPNESLRLWPGQFVVVRLTLATPEAIVVPSAAVESDQAGQHVFVVKNDQTAELRPVVVERTFGSGSVISRGLAEGETVITVGQLRVVPGQRVAIKTETDKAASPAAAAQTGKTR